jgi:TolA-binding protein
MRRIGAVAGIMAVLLVSVAGALAQESVESLAAEAKSLYERGRYGHALDQWMAVIGKHGRHEIVASGNAHWYAAKCLRQMGEFAEAAALLESYVRAHPKGKGVFSALTGIFHAWAEAGDQKKATTAGKVVFKHYPEAKGTFWVLRAFLERGWKVPKLTTSFDMLRYWAFERISGTRDPDLRLGVLELIEAWHRGSTMVSSGGVLYCKAWCHLKAGRYGEAVALGEKHLKHFPKGSERDKVRMCIAEALLAMDPPEIVRAKKVLGALIRNPGRFKDEAEKLLAAAKTGGTSIQITEGFPRPEGIGKVVVLTDLSSSSARLKALAPWMKAREAEVVRFRPGRVHAAKDALAEIGPEFVAVVVKPETVESNFQLDMLELCRGLDADAMPDFSYGYMVARDAEDLGALASRILEKEKVEDRGRAASIVGVPTSGGQVAQLDSFLHFGHGTPRRIVKGLSAAGIARLELPRGPVVFSGACFNGVCSRSYDRSIYEWDYQRPEDIDPAETVSMSWIHAGATGVIAALDGDRGEMAMAEWERFRESAAPLGEVITYQYRLVFACLSETYSEFPRYLPGKSKRTGFFDVMLRGQTSRILISDPSYRPLDAPLDPPVLATEAKLGQGSLTVRIEVKRSSPGQSINSLTGKPGPPWKESRVYARVALPEGFSEMLGRPEVKGPSGAKVGAKVRHEVWGGRRYANVLLVAAGRKLSSPGSVTVLTFPIQ